MNGKAANQKKRSNEQRAQSKASMQAVFSYRGLQDYSTAEFEKERFEVQVVDTIRNWRSRRTGNRLPFSIVRQICLQSGRSNPLAMLTILAFFCAL